MWSSNKIESVMEDRRTLQRIRNTSGISSLSTILLLVIFLSTDFLILFPIWTLRIISVVYVLLHAITYCIGQYGEAELWTWQWNRSTKTGRKVWLCCKAFLLHLISIALFYVIPILFGAPLLSLFTETVHFSVFITALMVFPGCLHFGSDEYKWLRITLGSGPQTVWERHWLRSSVCSLLGAWLGGFVIPLDWDRPWQAWPICCTYGTLAGYALYHLFSFLSSHVNHRKRSSVRSKIIN